MRVLTGVRTSEQLAELAEAFKAGWLAERVELTPKQLLTEIIRMPEETATAAVEQVVEAAAQLTGSDNALIADAAELVQIVAGKYPGDRGLLVAFVMNLVHLAPGEYCLQPPTVRCTPNVSGTAIDADEPLR